MEPRVRIDLTLHQGASALDATDVLAGLYRDAFCAPPWNEEEFNAVSFTGRLRADVQRPGFVAVIAESAGRPVGFGTAWWTRAPFPTDRRYGEVAAALGSQRVTGWLIGARKIDELAVSPHAQGQGIGRCLLDRLTGLDEGRGTWLLTSTRSPVTVPFYRKCGWHQITHPREGEEAIVVFLSPHHPQAPSHGVAAEARNG
ncbi:GNAT family N-acetyltransferase [Actinoallomurus sp. NPDC052274]|uniref:GNAT family N-acetyltransferase n=1 Tax=Actinoallomurus sp. NPDC052274 TaxID=3155420 RepID=UPI00341514D1